MKKEISPLYWCWVPIFFMIVQIMLEVFVPRSVLSVMLSENGPHETLQALIMLFSFLLASACVLNKRVSKTPLLRGWFFLTAICSLYVLAEEISYGQHIWEWATPDFWRGVNDQEETNLHNTSSWFDQKPRLVLILSIVVGTFIVPLLKKFKLIKIPQYLDVLLPAKQLSVVAFFVIVPQIFEKIFEVFDVQIFARFSEVQELYIFYFVFLYLLMLRKKLIMTS